MLENSDDDSDYSCIYSSGESDYGKPNPTLQKKIKKAGEEEDEDEEPPTFASLSKADRDDHIFLLW